MILQLQQQDNNAIVQHELDDITLQENKKLSAEAEAHGNIDPEINKNDIYDIGSMSLDENK